MKPKDFYSRWKKGMLELTPKQQLKGKMVGHIGGILGLLLAVGVLLYQLVWYFVVFILFMAWLQWIEFVGARQKYKQISKLMEFVEDKKIEGVDESGKEQTSKVL